jgi:hypothetical protein
MYPGYYLLAIASSRKRKVVWLVDENGKAQPQNYIPPANLRK